MEHMKGKQILNGLVLQLVLVTLCSLLDTIVTKAHLFIRVHRCPDRSSLKQIVNLSNTCNRITCKSFVCEGWNIKEHFKVSKIEYAFALFLRRVGWLVLCRINDTFLPSRKICWFGMDFEPDCLLAFYSRNRLAQVKYIFCACKEGGMWIICW